MGGGGVQQRTNGCDARTTGDSDIDIVARIFYAESTAGNSNTYQKMGQVVESRFRLQLKEFGCDIGGVAMKLSDADERGNKPYKAVKDNASLGKLKKDDCNAFKTAQSAARQAVNNARSDFRGAYSDPDVGGIALWWRGGAKPAGKNRITVGDTTFFSYDPQSPKTTGDTQYQKHMNRYKSNPAKGWHCGM